MMKKILASVMFVIISLQIVLPTVGFADVYTDWLSETGDDKGISVEVSNNASKYDAVICELSSIGILSGLSFSLSSDHIMSRGDFLQIVMNVEVGKENVSNVDKIGFSDVNDSDSCAWAVSEAVKRGFISGNGNGNFEPDAPITLAGAVKILVNALGYTVPAEANGGFPEGYLIQAKKVDILESEPENPQSLTMGESAELILNALNAKALERVVFGQSAIYETSSTWLKATKDIVRLEGIMEANEYTSLYAVSQLREGVVIIDGKEYETEGDFTNLLGYEICYYLKGDDTVIYAYAINDSVIRVDAEEIEDFSDRKFAWYENGKRRTMNVPKDAAVIYNGAAYPDYTSKTFEIKSGYIDFIKNGGSVSVVKIYENRPVYVSAVNTTNTVISDGISKSVIDYSKFDRFEFYDEHGNIIEPKMLSAGDILNMYISAKGEYGTAYKSVDKITGVLDSVSENGEMLVFSVNAREIKVSMAGSIKKGQFDLGSQVTLYLDAFGCAVYGTSKGLETPRYAYLFGYKENSSLDSKFVFRLYDSDALVKNIETTRGFRINGIKINDSDEIPSDIKDGCAVLYALNSDGLLNQLYTPDAEGSPLVTICPTSEKLFYSREQTYSFAPENTTAFSDSFIVNTDTLMFSIPNNPLSASTSRFSILNPTAFATFSKHNVSAYTQNKNSNVAELVLELESMAGTVVSSQNEAVLVTNVVTALNDECETVYKLTLSGKNVKNKAFKTIDSSVGADIEVGDFIIYDINGRSEITKIRKIIDVHGKDEFGNDANFIFDTGSDVVKNRRWYSNLALFEGYIYSNYDGMIRFAQADTNPEELGVMGNSVYFNSKKINIYEIDLNARRKELKVKEYTAQSNSGYLDSGIKENAILYVKAGTPMMILIYK